MLGRNNAGVSREAHKASENFFIARRAEYHRPDIAVFGAVGVDGIAGDFQIRPLCTEHFIIFSHLPGTLKPVIFNNTIIVIHNAEAPVPVREQYAPVNADSRANIPETEPGLGRLHNSFCLNDPVCNSRREFGVVERVKPRVGVGAENAYPFRRNPRQPINFFLYYL